MYLFATFPLGLSGKESFSGRLLGELVLLLLLLLDNLSKNSLALLNLDTRLADLVKPVAPRVCVSSDSSWFMCEPFELDASVGVEGEVEGELIVVNCGVEMDESADSSILTFVLLSL